MFSFNNTSRVLFILYLYFILNKYQINFIVLFLK